MPTVTIPVAAGADDGDVASGGTLNEWPPTSGGVSAATGNPNIIARKVRHQTFSFSEVIVGLMKFDTSSIPDNATITSAVLRISPVGKQTSESRTLDLEYYDPGTIAADDYALNVGTTAASVAAATWQAYATGSGTVDIALTNPDTNISKNGVTGLRIGISGGQPASGSVNDTNLSFAALEHASRDEPKLVITYTAPTPVSATRTIQYGVGGKVGATRQLQSNMKARVSNTRTLVNGIVSTNQYKLDLYVGIAFGYDPYATSVVYTDMTSRIHSWSFERGRRTVHDSIDPARLTATFHNQDRALDPSYAGSPYFPNVLPGVRIIVKVEDELVYSGFIEGWPQDWNARENTVTVTALDIFDTFNVDMIPGTVYPVQTSGARVLAGLAEIGVPSAWYAGVNTGIDDVQPHTAGEEDNWLEHFKKVAATEQGYLFQDRAGYVKFYQRHALSISPFTDVQITLHNDPGGGEWPFEDVDDPDFSVKDIKNDVRVTREGGATSRAFDTPSITKYRKRTYQTTTLHDSTTVPGDLATWILQRDKDPKLRPDGVTLAPQGYPGMTLPVVQRDLADRVRLKVQPPGPTGLIDLEASIQSIGMSMGEDRKLIVKWNLAPPPGSAQVWKLGTHTLGVDTYLGF
jgi:hypothetical protein